MSPQATSSAVFLGSGTIPTGPKSTTAGWSSESSRETGLLPPSAPGRAFAALHYQTPSHIITQAMEVDSAITLPLGLPGHSASLPATVLVYSDERRFIHPTLAGAVNLAESCRDASR